MSTIAEMDEFFNFEDAAHDHHAGNATKDVDYSHLATAGPYDIDLAFAEPENDENSFTCLQHFSAPEGDLSFQLNHAVVDTTMMGPDDFTDFPRWIAGMDVPTQPCSYCQRTRIHCKIIKEGFRKGSCTSCVALSRSCSLTFDSDSGHLRSMSNRSSQVSLLEKLGNADANNQSQLGDWKINDGNSARPPQSPVENHGQLSHNNSASNLVSLKSSSENINADLGDGNPKVGARFSRESVRILRGWLSTHHRHPYPTDDEKDSLTRQTGLNKTQITNWLANARRRGKVRAPRSTSPSVRNYANAMDIPRRATPALENMNPLERWKHSPPENEPASVTDIAKAVTSSTFSSGLESPYSYGHTDDGSSRSLCNVSSTSSLGTSHSSGGSFASAFSHKSRGSFGSFGSFGNRGRRRRRRQAPKAVQVPTNQPARTFQCTFCTETFKTKHDWQRHEKSLHLSLERWICCPNGPAQFCVDYDHNRCVFCGLPNPPDGHAEVHNYSSCVERSLEERTFYRKDHLRQHLNLVHDVKFQAFSMDSWKVATPEIRSRCGFCGIVMDSWSIRVDHLAEHFKGGKSMADWKGDWGFEQQVMEIVENGMPPYLIHDERNTPNPYEATKENAKDIANSDRTLEDWVKIGLVEHIHSRVLNGGMPTDEELLEEARKIVHEASSHSLGNADEVSWFRDLIMLSGTQSSVPEGDQTPGAPLQPWSKKVEMIAKAAQNNDLGTIPCMKQRALVAFVNARRALGLTPTTTELQVEACRILDEIEASSNFKCKGALCWFKYLITSSKDWLNDFRRRAGLPRTSEMEDEHVRSTDDKSIDYGIHNYPRLESALIDFVKVQRAAGIVPTDADLQRQARLIIFNNDDAWNQTVADDPTTLHLFKRQNGLAPESLNLHALDEDPENSPNPRSYAVAQFQSASSPKSLHWDFEGSGLTLPSPGSNSSSEMSDKPIHTRGMRQPSTNTNPTQPLKYFLNDAHCYQRLVRELTRFVTASTSPNNPNQHVPTDAEIQNQARWVIYDDDDPWNQTAADNAEWLIRFKRDVGLAPPDDGPGLPLGVSSWTVGMGGSGFSPPYLFHKEPPAAFTDDVNVQMKDKIFSVKGKTVDKFAKSMGTRYQPPAQIFCSRDLENELGEFLECQIARGIRPSDDILRAKAREILGVEKTAADDQELLEKFKTLYGLSPSTQHFGDTMPPFDDVLQAEFDHEIQNMDLSGLDVMTGLSSMDIPMTAAISPLDQSQAQSFLPGAQQDYAELYRVNAATASPLRRRASVKMAAQSGFAFPAHQSQQDPLVLNATTSITTTAISPQEPHMCDSDFVENFEAEQRAKGVLTPDEIAEEGSRMLGRYLERRWKEEEANAPAYLASGPVRLLPGSGIVGAEEWQRWSRIEEKECGGEGEELKCDRIYQA